MEFILSIIDEDLSFEAQLDGCPGEAEALRLGRDLEAAAILLHNVVVADRALVMKAADAIQFSGRGKACVGDEWERGECAREILPGPQSVVSATADGSIDWALGFGCAQ